MILFRCSSCGEAYRVEDRYGGGPMECHGCGHVGEIPRESDPEVLLIFRAGDPEEGVAMPRAALERLAEQGELSPADLVLQDGVWGPLVEDPDEGTAPAEEETALRLTLASDDGDPPEIIDALPLLEWPVADDEELAEALVSPRRRLLSLVRAGPVAPGPEALVARKRRPLLLVLQVAAGLLAVVFGYKCGVGPIVAQARGKPTYVFVDNHGDTAYAVRLGWRRLKQELTAHSMCQFDLYVGMPEKQGLVLKPEGGGKAVKLRVPVRPGCTVLVNLGQEGTYAVYDPDVGRSQAAGASVRNLANQLSQRSAPAACVEIAAVLRRVGGESFKGTVNDLFLDGRTYDLRSAPGPGRSEEEQQERQEEAPKLHVTAGDRWRVQLADGYTNFIHTKPDAFDGGVRLPATDVQFPGGMAARITGREDLQVRGSGEAVSASLDLRGVKVRVPAGVFTGTWRYRASFPGTVKGKPAWSWSWAFGGRGEVEGERRSLSVRIDGASNESVIRLQEAEPLPGRRQGQ